MGTGENGGGRRAAEAVFFGLGCATLACWISVALVGSFRGDLLLVPYWPAIPWLRTDTTGVAAFGVSAVCLLISRYLRLRSGRPAAAPGGLPARIALPRALAETVTLMAVAAFAYLSNNAYTHYGSLRLQLTHLWPWPSEGTVRVIALALIAVSVAVSRYLRSAPVPAPGPAAGPARAARNGAAGNGVAAGDGAGFEAGRIA